MLSLHHILALGLFATTLVSCERSSRNVDVQPTTNNKLPNSNGDGKGGTLPDSGTPNTPGGTPNTPGGTPNTPGGTPTPTPIPGVPTPTPNPNGGDADVFINPSIGGNPQAAAWDGKSFLGNSKWQIEAVN